MPFDSEQVLQSIGLPATGMAREFFESRGIEGVHDLNTLMTEEAATALWQEWNGADARIANAAFRRAFQGLLADALDLGLNLERFRDMCTRLPEPDSNAENWFGAFERVVEGRDRCIIRIYLSDKRYAGWYASGQDDAESEWQKMLGMMRDGLFYELGVLYPEIVVAADAQLGDTELRIEWNDLVLPPRGTIGDDEALVNTTPEELLNTVGIESQPASNPANGNPAALIAHADCAACEAKSLTTWDSQGYSVLQISHTVRRASAAFVNRLLVDRYLEQLALLWPLLVEELDVRLDRDVLTRILRSLVREGLSIRDLRTIAEAIISAVPSRSRKANARSIIFDTGSARPMFTGATPDSRKSVADYLKVARTALKRYISHKYTRGENTLSVYLLDPRAEGRLRQPEPLTSEELETVVDEVATELGMHSGSHFVVLTDDDVRPRLYAALRPSLPHVAVLSYAELSPDMNITPIARFNPPLEAYDESVFRLIASLPGNDAPLPELAGLQGNPALPAGLAGTGGHAPEQITDSLQARYPFEMEHPAAKHLVDVMWAGLLASMTAAELPRDSTLAKVIETVLRAPGVSASKIGKFVFTMAEAASAMVEENLAPAPADMALSAAAEAHDRLESGAHRLVQSFARDGFAARYKGVLA